MNKTTQTERVSTRRVERDRFLVFGAPNIGEEEIAEVVDSLRSGWICTGPKVARFEEAFRRCIGSQHAAAVNSCTAGHDRRCATDITKLRIKLEWTPGTRA